MPDWGLWLLWIVPTIVCWTCLYFWAKEGLKENNNPEREKFELTELIGPAILSLVPMFNIIFGIAWTISDLHNSLCNFLDGKQKQMEDHKNGIRVFKIDGQEVRVTRQDIYGEGW